MSQQHQPNIVDVRKQANDDDNVAKLRTELINGLQAPVGSKRVSTMLLYDEAGLKIYDKITTDATEYYVR